MSKFDPADTERGRHELEAEAEEAAEEPRNWRRRPFRIIRGAGGNYKVQYYGTKEKRDAAAQVFADRDGTSVITELWDASHSQDDLNQGWGCDGHREPRVFCQWYALCDHEAAGTITHPVLGEVPCCQRCADKHDLKFTEVSA